MTYKVRTVERVRFSDLDAVGHLNNAVFLTYMEQARVAYVSRLNIYDHCFQSKTGVGLILARAEVDYLAPAFLNEEIEISIAVTDVGHKSISMDYELFSLTRSMQVGKGKSVIVAYDYKAKKAVSVPAEVRAAIKSIES